MITLKKNYIPVVAIENDEIFPNGIFVWNISRIIDFIEHNKDNIITEEIAVSDYYNSYFRVNEEHLPSVNIAVPIILAEINPGKYNVIDGHHRLAKACIEGISQIKAYKLKVDQHIPFFISVTGYKAFIEYWNSKI